MSNKIVDVFEHKHSKWCEYCVSSNGCGISANKNNKNFAVINTIDGNRYGYIGREFFCLALDKKCEVLILTEEELLLEIVKTKKEGIRELLKQSLKNPERVKNIKRGLK